jgi:8-oxo-dGTP pyrophosphatase MutT (NUDIX family)
VADGSGGWTTLGSHVVYSNPWCVMREDRVIRPDGTQGVYGVLELSGSVGVVALDASYRVLLVQQWRYVQGRSSIEIPGGALEVAESPAQAAARELREETGFEATSWRSLATIDNCNGITTDVAHLYLATGLHPSPDGHRGADPAEPTQTLWWPMSRAVDAAVTGEITESVSVAALLKAHLLVGDGEPRQSGR